MSRPDRVLVDADVLSKLAHWELLDLIPQAFDLPWSSFATTPSVQHRARRALTKSDKLFLSKAAAEATYSAVAQMSPLPEAMDQDYLLSTQRLPGLDPGEAVLLATVIANPGTYMLTGDKRALATAGSSHSPKSRTLEGRVICLEQFILYALDKVGLDELRRHLCRDPPADRSIVAIMGSGCTAPEVDVRQGLDSYIRDAKSSSGALLADWPPT